MVYSALVRVLLTNAGETVCPETLMSLFMLKRNCDRIYVCSALVIIDVTKYVLLLF